MCSSQSVPDDWVSPQEVSERRASDPNITIEQLRAEKRAAKNPAPTAPKIFLSPEQVNRNTTGSLRLSSARNHLRIGGPSLGTADSVSGLNTPV